MTGAVIGFDVDRSRQLADALSLPFEAVRRPEVTATADRTWSFAAELDDLVLSVAGGPGVDTAVVSTWTAAERMVPLVETPPDVWLEAVELQLGLWYRAVTSIATRCADGGSLVIVVERPAAIDSAGQSATTTVAEGLVTLTRSIALVHGARGVRANAVSSALATAPDVLLGLAPPLPGYPGTVEAVAGAVRAVLGADASAVSGTLVRADCGRSW
jgi:NAD(P)-dependent dehydrogenase (short-subunit alcohol dehydrogenase family)